MTEVAQFDIHGILKLLPHRYPFLMVDRVLECRAGESIRALKNVTFNEPYFMGHFPQRPVMPGVMIIEALAQTAGILAFVTGGVVPNADTKFYFVGIDKARFRKPVVPGDLLMLEVVPLRKGGAIWKLRGEAKVDGVVVAEAELLASIQPRDAAAAPKG